jgi:hypothetical protein
MLSLGKIPTAMRSRAVKEAGGLILIQADRMGCGEALIRRDRKYLDAALAAILQSALTF